MSIKVTESAEWLRLHPVQRIELISVLMDLRPGCQIEYEHGSNITNLRNVFEVAGLEFAIDGLLSAYYASNEKGLIHSLGLGDVSNYNKIYPCPCCADPRIITNLGRFLLYPVCCVTEFIQVVSNDTQHEDFFKKWLGLVDSSDAGLSLLYCFHIPCSTECKDSLEFGSQVKGLLDTDYPELSEYFLQHKKKYLAHESGITLSGGGG